MAIGLTFSELHLFAFTFALTAVVGGELAMAMLHPRLFHLCWLLLDLAGTLVKRIHLGVLLLAQGVMDLQFCHISAILGCCVVTLP